MRHDQSGKVMVIGIDGGAPELVFPLVRQGRLPNLARLMRGGVWGKLESTIPPLSPPAWASFLTGTNPGKHGVFHFLTQPRGAFDTSICDSQSIHGVKLWELLGERGKRVGFIDVPLTYPPVEVNGFMISGLPTPSEESVFTYPPWLHTELLGEFGDFPLEDRTVEKFFSGAGYLEVLRELYRFTASRREAVPYLLRRFNCDFLMVVFRGSDLIQHRAWQFFDEGYRQRHPEETRKLGQVIPQYYEEIDRSIGSILEFLDEPWTVLVMSDHGAGPLRSQFLMNLWLIRNGYLRLKPGLRLRARKVKLKKRRLGELARRVGGPLLSRVVPGKLANVGVTIPRLEFRQPWQLVDWPRTRAYSNWSSTESMIRVNLKGREPAGSVEPGPEYESLREQLIREFSQVTDPETGQPITERIFRREEIYEGPFLNEAPDLLIMTRDWAYPFYGDLAGRDLFRRPEDLSPSVHLSKGLFVLYGSGVREGGELEGASILDLPATILYLLGIPLPRRFDGRVLAGAFPDGVLEGAPPEYVDRGEEETTHHREALSDEERARVERSLKGLGYIG